MMLRALKPGSYVEEDILICSILKFSQMIITISTERSSYNSRVRFTSSSSGISVNTDIASVMLKSENFISDFTLIDFFWPGELDERTQNTLRHSAVYTVLFKPFFNGIRVLLPQEYITKMFLIQYEHNHLNKSRVSL